ncbi:rho GTPase-activating protein gacV-like [Xenopus laevis]|uniref:Rho GTPase-activating protein gacV-like n=1 Tax=Xenopus laevis TaxID=8355 RepID=A0A8J1LJR7_XENLA|nr:rho GTPase-activating protein gacV-like [Xenopus laevis]
MILDCQLLSHASFFMLQEVLKRERASLKNAKLPPGHPTRLQNRRQKYEYLRLENTIKHHFCQFQIELLREQKLREAARKKQMHRQTPAAKEKEDGATAAAEEGALASKGKEGAKEKEEEEDAAPGKEQQEEQQEKMEEQSPAVKEQVGMKRKRNEEEAPAAENKEEGADGEEEAPPRKRPRKDYRGFSVPPEDSAASNATLLLACLLWLFMHICVFVIRSFCGGSGGGGPANGPANEKHSIPSNPHTIHSKADCQQN